MNDDTRLPRPVWPVRAASDPAVSRASADAGVALPAASVWA
jgi:hypothetical protein